MPSELANPMLAPFLAAAEAAAKARPEVDVELARELLAEAATMLHNGLALDGLDEHDTVSSSTLWRPTSSRAIRGGRCGRGPRRP